MQRVINAFFIIAITLGICLFVIGVTGAHAEESSVQRALRLSTLRVDGLSCIGSGFVTRGASGKKYVITNSHVCHCAKYIGNLFSTQDDGTLFKSKVVKENWEYDLCAAELKEDLPALPLADTFPPGSEINTRGYPCGRLTQSHGRALETIRWAFNLVVPTEGCPAVTTAMISVQGKVTSCVLEFTSTRVSVYVRGGSSGSPVVNDSGQLVGVVSTLINGDKYDGDGGMVTFAQLKAFLGGL